MILGFWALACTVDTLKVQRPPRGIQSISPEDLQRDVWAQLNPESEIEHAEWLSFRFKQHQAILDNSAPLAFCAAQPSPSTWLWVKPVEPSHAPFWTAILLSAAKGLEPEGSGGFCLGIIPEEANAHDLSELLQFHSALNAHEWSPDSIHFEALSVELQGVLAGI